ncbi:MAG: HNH endonuclease family protein, partial [Gemmatimonadota bacterium]|nr:HNH endonuclease family protein [Gemmatimonadota bacterium]
WRDADSDCKDTRAEVLMQETKVKVTFSSSSGYCRVVTGKWLSMFDNKTYTSASDVQIDHHIPVHEAWGSGARGWTQSRRVAFNNDLTDKRALNAVTSSLNSSKGARDPAEWMPPANRCNYIAKWVVVKARWRLSVDATEKATLQSYASSCTNITLRYHRQN